MLASDSAPGSLRPVLLAAALIVAAGLAAYHNSFDGAFVFDDHLSIVENPTLRSLATAWAPPRGSGLTVEGRPLLNASLALSYALSGAAPAGYHAINLLIHLGAALALFGCVRRTLAWSGFSLSVRGAATSLGLAAAVLWVVHPLQTESVTYLVQRAESQMGLFYLLALYAFIRGVEPGASPRWFGGAVLAGFAGVATKEVAASAPVVVLLYDRTFVAGSVRAAWRARRWVHGGLFATWLLAAWLAVMSGNRGGTVGFGSQVGWWSYELAQADAIVRYLRLALWPAPLIFDYGVAWPASLAAVAPQALSIMALLVGTAVALVRRPALGFLGFWLFVMLAPTSLIPGNRQTLAEHRMYLSLVAVILAVVLGGYKVASAWRWWRQPAGMAVVAGWAIALIILTVRRNEDYRSELALYRDTVAKRPGNAHAHYNLGKLLAESGDPAGAVPEYQAAIAGWPEFAPAHFNLGNALTELGQLREAEAAFRGALRLKPDYAKAHYNLGNVLVQLGRRDEARECFAAAVRSSPEMFEARENLGGVLLELGRLDEARTEFERVLRVAPDRATAHFNLGNVHWLSGRWAEAAGEYETALRLDPRLEPARQQLELARQRAAGGR